METVNTQLLRAILTTVGRRAIPLDELRAILLAGGRAAVKQVKAYNLCDGTRTQAEIGKQLRIDAGSMSRTVKRWVEAGIVFKITNESGTYLQHVYPSPTL